MSNRIPTKVYHSCLRVFVNQRCIIQLFRHKRSDKSMNARQDDTSSELEIADIYGWL